MSHPFGDLVSQHLHRKHGLSQSKLAAGIGQAPTVITAMCKGRRLIGPQARERVVAIIGWLHQQGALDTLDEANALLNAAGMSGLTEREIAGANLRGLGEARAVGRKLRTDPGGFRRRHNLPAPLTSFIGREKEIEAIAAQVRVHRLVTLTGAGGIGKTRLALELARRMVGASESLALMPASFDDGVWLVNLAPVSNAALVPQVVIAALKLVEQPGRDPLDILAGYLEERRTLLILDNCEHVIDACAALVDQLLGRCPELHVLATSRETLRVPGEITHRVASLALPGDASAMQSAESVMLFVDRARASQPAFDLDATNASAVARICRQLDGIPLAIELAAALLSSMSVAEAASLLSDRLSPTANGFRAVASRHQTMRAALDWSYDLLSPDEQRALARLSVFAGGWLLEQAEAVCGDDVVETRRIASLLVHKSLVLAEPQGEHTRYRLLEPIRQYAAEKLDETGEADAVHRRHALAYLALAQAAKPHLHAHQQRRWLDRLEREHDNFRAALTWSQSEAGNPDLGLQLASALSQFWWIRAHVNEGRRWLEALLRMAGPETSPALRAWASLGAAMLGRQYFGFIGLGDPPTVLHQLEAALTLFRAIGDDAGIALTLCELGAIAGALYDRRRDPNRALSLIEESLSVSRRHNEHSWITAYALLWLACITYWQADLPHAMSLLEECLESARLLGDAQIISTSLKYLADVSGAQLDFALAAKFAEEALRVAREINDTTNELLALRQLADEYRYMGEFDRATVLIEEMRSISLAHDMRDAAGWALTMFGLIARDQGDYGRATSFFRDSIVWYRDKLDIWGNWWNVLGLATLATMQEQPQRAAQLYGAFDVWQRGFNHLRMPHNQRQFGTYIEATRAELGEAAYVAAFEQGRAMTTEQAFLYALSHEDEDEQP